MKLVHTLIKWPDTLSHSNTAVAHQEFFFMDFTYALPNVWTEEILGH